MAKSNKSNKEITWLQCKIISKQRNKYINVCMVKEEIGEKNLNENYYKDLPALCEWQKRATVAHREPQGHIGTSALSCTPLI